MDKQLLWDLITHPHKGILAETAFKVGYQLIFNQMGLFLYNYLFMSQISGNLAVECCYNVVHHNMILHLIRQWLRENMHQSLYS